MLIGNLFEIELRGVKETKGHDDSLPFNANLYINNKKVAECYNDGWGSVSVVTPIKHLELFKIASIAVQQTVWFEDVYYTMNTLVDVLANEAISKQQINKFVKKHQDKNIVMKRGGNLCRVKVLKTLTIPESFKECSNNRDVLLKMKERYESEGYEVLNTNF